MKSCGWPKPSASSTKQTGPGPHIPAHSIRKNRYAVVNEPLTAWMRKPVAFFSLFRGVAADDRFHGLYLPPHAGRQIDTEGFRHQRQRVVVEPHRAAHAGHAELGSARLEQFPCGGVPRHEIGTTALALFTIQIVAVPGGLPAGGAVFRTLTGKPLPDRR